MAKADIIKSNFDKAKFGLKKPSDLKEMLNDVNVTAKEKFLSSKISTLNAEEV